MGSVGDRVLRAIPGTVEFDLIIGKEFASIPTPIGSWDDGDPGDIRGWSGRILSGEGTVCAFISGWLAALPEPPALICCIIKSWRWLVAIAFRFGTVGSAVCCEWTMFWAAALFIPLLKF